VSRQLHQTAALNQRRFFLSHDILIIENLCNLDKLPEKFRVFAFPLKVNTDGVPVRVVAEKI